MLSPALCRVSVAVSFFILLFGFAKLWLHLKAMPQVRSHCVCAALTNRRLVSFDSLSVRLMFQKVDMCAACDAVFTELPHQVSLLTAYMAQKAPDKITQFTAALSSGWQQSRGEERGNRWTHSTMAQAPFFYLIKGNQCRMISMFFSQRSFCCVMKTMVMGWVRKDHSYQNHNNRRYCFHRYY